MNKSTNPVHLTRKEFLTLPVEIQRRELARQAEQMKKPASVAKSLEQVLDVCPYTGERQKLTKFSGSDRGLVLLTKSKSIKWKHTLVSEEI